MAIEFEKDGECRKRSAFVPIDKRVVAEDRPTERGTELRNRSCPAIDLKIPGTTDRGFKRILVPNAWKATVPLKQTSMNVTQHVGSNELKAHLANSR